MKTFKIGLIGFGFIGKVHAQAYHSIPYCFPDSPFKAQITAVLRNHPTQDEDLLQTLQIPLCTNDERLFWEQDFDILDICTPNSSHYAYCKKAIEKNIPIYCEKPLTNNIEEARTLVKLAEERNLATHTAFTLRFRPAVALAKDILTSKYLGEIYHFQTRFFHSSYLDPNRPMSWRLQANIAGGGALTDLGIHSFDLIHYLLGDCEWLQCQTKTFIKTRPKINQTEPAIVDVDDWAHCILQIKNGGIGSVESSRMAGGSDDLTDLEIYGSQGSLKIDFNHPEKLYLFDATKKCWILSETLPHDIPATFSNSFLWPATKQSLGAPLNAHIASIVNFFNCLEKGIPSSATFKDACASQEFLHAAYCSAAEEGEKVFLPA